MRATVSLCKSRLLKTATKQMNYYFMHSLSLSQSDLCERKRKTFSSMCFDLRECIWCVRSFKQSQVYLRPEWNRGLHYSMRGRRRCGKSLWEFRNARNRPLLTEDKRVADACREMQIKSLDIKMKIFFSFKHHKSEKLPWHHNVKLSSLFLLLFIFCLFVFLSLHHSDQMSEGSQVTLCVPILKWYCIRV